MISPKAMKPGLPGEADLWDEDGLREMDGLQEEVRLSEEVGLSSYCPICPNYQFSAL